MRNVNCIILSAADTGSQNGSQIDANQLVSASFQGFFGDATATGTLKIQASNDIPPSYYQASNFTVTNWTDITDATAAVATGGSVLITIPNMAYRWVRAVYTRDSGGSTTVTVNMNALGM